MAYARFQATAQDVAGNVLPSASIEVRLESSGSLVSVFSDRDGVTPLGNPFTADSNGYFYFHAPGGAYKVTATLGDAEQVWRYVAVGTAAESDIIAGTSMVSVKDFGAVGDGTTDDTAAIQDAIDSGAAALWFDGVFAIDDPAGLTGVSNQRWVGSGKGTAVLKATVAPTADLVKFTSKSNFSIEGIGINWNEQTAAGDNGSLVFESCSIFSVMDCAISKIDKLGIVVNGCLLFEISGNSIDKTTATGATLNSGILVTGSAGLNAYGKINDNVLTRTGILLTMAYSEVCRNTVDGQKYGAGIVTEQDALSTNLRIADNQCLNGVGTDANGYRVGGIENWAPNSIITGNQCITNSGAGIDQGGKNCVVDGNLCANNGTSVGTPLPGIAARYTDGTYNASGSIFSNNRCFDALGAGGTQTHGYVEESSSLSGILLDGNNFAGNKTAETVILSSTTTRIGADASTTVKGIAELATDAEVQAKSDTARVLTPSNLAALGVSDTFAGLIEAAVQSEMEAASSIILAVTPGRQHYHPSAAKMWGAVTYAAGVPTLQANYNVTSITDGGVGILTVTIANDFSSANWAESVQPSGNGGNSLILTILGAKAAGTVAYSFFGLTTAALADPDRVSFSGFGDQ